MTVHLVRLSGQIAERNNKAITIRIGADADAQIIFYARLREMSHQNTASPKLNCEGAPGNAGMPNKQKVRRRRNDVEAKVDSLTGNLAVTLEPIFPGIGGTLVAVNNALYVSGSSYMETLQAVCSDGYMEIVELITIHQAGAK